MRDRRKLIFIALIINIIVGHVKYIACHTLHEKLCQTDHKLESSVSFVELNSVNSVEYSVAK